MKNTKNLITWIDISLPVTDYNMTEEQNNMIWDHLELIPKGQRFCFGFDDNNNVYLKLEGEKEIIVIKSNTLKGLEEIQKLMDSKLS